MSGQHSHQHGGTAEVDMARLGISPRSVLDFSVNTSPLGPPTEINEAWNDLAAEMRRYPSVEGKGIVAYFRERLNLREEFILAGNGSIEVIYLAPRALGLRSVAIVTPSFHDYTRASRLAGAEVISVELSADTDFASPDFEELRRTLTGADALLIGNPNNPTGTVFPREILLKLSEEFPDKWLLVDEAFVQFLDSPEQVTLAADKWIRRNILVFQSLTKLYGIPGLRIGCAVAHPETISRMARFKEPWTVNRIAEMAAPMLVDCRAYEEELRQLVMDERERIFGRLRKISGLRAYTPSANFFLCQWTSTGDLDDLLRFLLSEGLYVRDCRNFPGLENNFFRFGLRRPEENDKLLSAIERAQHTTPLSFKGGTGGILGGARD